MTDDRSAGRYAETEIEVAGTPEEVWQAIATGPGHASWTFGADIEPVTGGQMIIHREPFGPDAEVIVTDWEPPCAFGFAESNPGVPSPLTTEILVEARSGGICVVRVVCGLADVGDEWEDLVEGVSEGWRMSLLVLRAYLRWFSGRRADSVDVISTIDPPPANRDAPADMLFGQLGLPRADRVAGQRFETAPGSPALSGVVEHASQGYLLLRSEAPYPGLFAISCFPMGSDQPISINLLGRIYAALDAEHLASVTGSWRSWLAEQTTRIVRADHHEPGEN